jgi:hypothetical protein
LVGSHSGNPIAANSDIALVDLVRDDIHDAPILEDEIGISTAAGDVNQVLEGVVGHRKASMRGVPERF